MNEDRRIDGPTPPLPHPTSQQILRVLTEDGFIDPGGSRGMAQRRLELLNFIDALNTLGGEVFGTFLVIAVNSARDEHDRLVCRLSAAAIGVLRNSSRDTVKKHIQRMKEGNYLRAEGVRDPQTHRFTSWQYVLYDHGDAPADENLSPLVRKRPSGKPVGPEAPTGPASGEKRPTGNARDEGEPLVAFGSTGREQRELPAGLEASAGHAPQFAVDDVVESENNRLESNCAPGSITELIAALLQQGMAVEAAARLASEMPDECCRQLAWLPQRKNVRSTGAYLVAAIEKRYGPPEQLLEAREPARPPALQAEDEEEPWRRDAETVFAALPEAERQARLSAAQRELLEEAGGNGFASSLASRELLLATLAEGRALASLAEELGLKRAA